MKSPSSDGPNIPILAAPASFHTHSKMLYGESTLNFSCQEVKNRGSTFWHKALIKTEKQLKPKTHTIPGRFSLHTPPPSNIYNICAHSTTHYGYLTRNYLTLKSYVLDSEHGCLHLLIEILGVVSITIVILMGVSLVIYFQVSPNLPLR